jgi:positive regulator of sigma E activity
MERTGIVLERISKDRARIRLLAPEACESCGACHMAASKSDYAIEAIDPIGAGVGRKVLLKIPPKSVLKASLMMYILPLVLFLGFYGLAFGLLRSSLEERLAELAGVVAGGLAVGILLVLMRRGRVGRGMRSTLPTVTAVLEDDAVVKSEGPGCNPGP